MIRITLQRHAKVLPTVAGWTGNRNCATAIADYSAAPIQMPPADAVVPQARYIVASSLRRSQDTALALYGRIDHVDRIFREAELPTPPLPWIRLPPPAWFALARIAWWAGQHSDQESYGAFKIRAVRAAARLIALAQAHGDVTLVGHGLINRAIAQALRSAGFEGPRRTPGQTLSWASYQR